MPYRWTIPRHVTCEIMDSPTINSVAHLQALAGLERINRISGTARQIIEPLSALARRTGLSHLSLLDVACGGGDVPIAVALAAKKRGLHLDLTLLDRSATALHQASARATSTGIVNRVIQAEVVSPLPLPDVVTSTLFFHHLRQPAEVISLLQNMRGCARHMIIISDLRRTRWGLAAAWIGCRALSRSRMVHSDGVASVRAAWTPEELLDLATQAGLTGVRIYRRWPWRMLLVWERSSEIPRDKS